MRLAKALKKSKRGILSRWKRHIVVNSMQARLRAQLGDRSEYSGERRRRSVVVASIVLTITDPLRGSYPLLCNLQAALIRSCGASLACMELTIISRFQRLQTSRKYSLHSLFYSFSVLSPSACFQIANTLQIGYQKKLRIHRKCYKGSFYAVTDGPLQREISHAGKFIPFC